MRAGKQSTGLQRYAVDQTLHSVGPYSFINGTAGKNLWCWIAKSDGHVSPATITVCNSGRVNSLRWSMRALYSDGTARKKFTRCRRIDEIAVSTDDAVDKTSVPPLKRLPNIPAIELSKAIDESSRNRCCCSSA